MRRVVNLLLVAVSLLLVVGITGCQPQIPEIPCSIEVTSPGHWEGLNGNETYEITWNWVGPTNKKVNIILMGYTEDEDELGTMLIASNVLGVNGSYIWGPNFGESIFGNFGGGENWPWWFRIKIEVVGNEEVYGISDLFAVQWEPDW